jgi:ribosomal protein S18 acetylase RimI-like enzyme
MVPQAKNALTESDIAIRRATESDLDTIYDIWYTLEAGDDPGAPPRGSTALLRHEIATADVYVAEIGDQIAGFAATVVRGAVAFLSECFVRAECQSRGVGGALVRRLLPSDGRVRCTLSSRDPRALALYIRAGMRPQWPNFCLRAETARLRALPAAPIDVIAAESGDPALVAWDTAIGGRPRPEDHAYWVDQASAVPLWFRRGATTIGYGYAQLRTPEDLWQPNTLTLGPIGARTAEDALGCVAAAVRWASPRATILRMTVPGPHPALVPLLEVGFQITYVETFVSSAAEPFVDAGCYILANSTLF